uniref:AAA+ ATPase domain-containing protein n=1 Tax=Polysiphonia urceolata TaxID=173545 RepID=A0A1Z1MC82_POLUR|nr:hypothetical protein [Polysiphonia stricta]ARW63549.1 hypothetical protein [Polysiphonia stricta]
MLIADDLDNLLDILPDFVKKPLNEHSNKKLLIEVVMDLGRRPEARFPNGPEYLSTINITWNNLDFCIKRIPQFSGDNRSGIECTLHRISSIKNRKGNVVGLTFRVGRAIFGTISHIRDILYTQQSILLLGKPGVGKTTAIREITRVLADEMQKRVVIIDTSNEIAGDGDIPHPAIGRARRMQVTRPELQHQVMIEAVENHMPEVIIIDEIGTELEALAARTIAERGVQLVGTAHGNCLDSVIKNPILCDLIGGIQYVTLGDDEAKRRGSQKSIVERKAVPAFPVAIEIHHRDSWIVHERVDHIVDQVLQGSNLSLQRRTFNLDGSISIQCEISNSSEFTSYNNYSINDRTNPIKYTPSSSDYYNNINKLSKSISNSLNPLTSFNAQSKLFVHHANKNLIRLYIHGINIQQVELAINNLSLSILITRDIMKADYILGLRSIIKHSSKIRQFAKSKKIVIYTINSHHNNNIIRALKQLDNNYQFPVITWYKLCWQKTLYELDALIETRYAIEKIIFQNKQSIELLPRSISIRKLQGQLITSYNLNYSILGKIGFEKLIIYPQ